MKKSKHKCPRMIGAIIETRQKYHLKHSDRIKKNTLIGQLEASNK